jgi:hypothetical protein
MAIVEVRGDKTVLEIALNDGRQISRTAQKIYAATVDDSLNQFDVIVDATMKNGCLAFEGYTTPEARAIYKKHFNVDVIKRPTVIWNPRYDLECLCDLAGIRFNPANLPAHKSKKDARLLDGDILYKHRNTQRPTLRATRWKLPAWVVLYHELGHAIQYFEAVVSKNARQRAEALAVKFGADFEADNLTRHENKICAESGLPVRKYYLSDMAAFEEYIGRYITDQAEKKLAIFIADNPTDRVAIERKLKESIKQNTGDYAFPAA